MNEVAIRQVAGEAELEALRVLFRAHFDRTGLDPTFSGIEREIAALPGIYAPPQGVLLVAVCGSDGAVLGGAAVRPLPGPGDCALSAVLVAPGVRGIGLGARLSAAAIAGARAAGHRQMHLDTLDREPAAMALWEAAGFVPALPYFPNPRPGSVHLSLDLTGTG